MFGSLYVLFCYREILPYASIGELCGALAVVLAAVFGLNLALNQLFPRTGKGGILTSLCVLFFCYFSDLKMALERMLLGTSFDELTRARYLLPFLAILTVACGVFVVRTRSKLLRLKAFLNFISVAMVLAIGITVCLALFRLPAVEVGSKRTAAPLQLPQKPPDIFYILMDAHTSPESLKRYWKYDISQFTSFLQSSGFQVVKNARANYAMTPYCMAASLNMNYPPDVPTRLSLVARCNFLVQRIQQGEAPARLRASGYRLVDLAVFPIADESAFYRYPGVGLTTLWELMWHRTAWGYVNTYQKRRGFAAVNLNILSRLPDLAGERHSSPRFVYAHVMMPHWPYLFDREGNPVVRGMSERDSNKEDYLDYLIYGTKLLTNTVTKIILNSAVPPIIVIQGDHGFRYLPGRQKAEEATTILNAYYLPGSEPGWVYDGITPVNSFRMIFNHYFGQNYPYLPDKSEPIPTTPN